MPIFTGSIFFTPSRCESINWPWSRSKSDSASLDGNYQYVLSGVLSNPVRMYRLPSEDINCPLTPSLLPRGLRRLQLSHTPFPLQVGSIPSTVEVLQIPQGYPHSLAVNVLPSSLIHLVLDCTIQHPLSAHALPLSLQRLYIWRYDHPLTVDVLPSSLRALVLGRLDHPLERGFFPQASLIWCC